jgi:hypothetical protein
MQCITQESQGKYLIKLLSQAFCRKLHATLIVAAFALASFDDATQINLFLCALYHPKKPGQIPYQVVVTGILQETTCNTDGGGTSLDFFGLCDTNRIVPICIVSPKEAMASTSSSCCRLHLA